MSSFFEKLKSAVGLNSVTNISTENVEDEFTFEKQSSLSYLNYGDIEYDITFQKDALGFSVCHDPQDLPMVSRIHDKDLYKKKNLRINDIIISVNSEEVISFDHFMEALCNALRNKSEITLRFLRKTKDSGPQNVFASYKTQLSPSDFVRAAQTRNKYWVKRLSAARVAKPVERMNSFSELAYEVSAIEKQDESISEKTQTALKREEESETKIFEELGYNPFLPNASDASSPRPAENTSYDQEVLAEELKCQVDHALSLILAEAVSDTARAQTALHAIYKMLTDLLANKEASEYKSIKLEDATFRAEVVSVDGGLDFMLSAGYLVSCDKLVGDSDNPDLNICETHSVTHSVNDLLEPQLKYCISRLASVLE